MRNTTGTLRAEAGAAKHESDWESLVIQANDLVIEPRSQDGVCRVHHDVVPTLNTAGGGQRQPCVMSVHQNQCGEVRTGDVANTLSTNSNPSGRNAPLIAFAANQRDEVRDLGDKAGALQAEPGMKQQTFVMGGICDGDAVKADTREILRKLRDKIGAEAFAVWGFGILDSLQSEEILQSGLYVGTLVDDRETPGFQAENRGAREGSCQEGEQQNHQGDLLRKLWNDYCKEIGCSPQGWEHIEQFTRELNAVMQELPQLNPRQGREMSALWQTDKGTRLLRKALSEIQAMGRSKDSKNQSTYTTYAVRRLVPVECLRLQGFPDNWLDIEGMSDTAKYKAVGNSVAVPCVEFVMSGIARCLR